jgi:FMN phosphatase YigB (HAD superfamily)
MEYMLERVPDRHRTALRGVYRQLDLGLLSYDEFLSAAAPLLGMSRRELRTKSEAHHIRNDELFSLVHELAPRYRLGLLSNAGQGVIERLMGQELARFDATIVSSEVGVMKPSPEIYGIAAARLECEPADCLMIDDIEVNVTGARQAGLQAVRYESVATLRADLKAKGIS